MIRNSANSKILQGGAVAIIRSLNIAARKKETDRIERENHAFAKRLFDKQPSLNRKYLDEEYQAHLKLKK